MTIWFPRLDLMFSIIFENIFCLNCCCCSLNWASISGSKFLGSPDCFLLKTSAYLLTCPKWLINSSLKSWILYWFGFSKTLFDLLDNLYSIIIMNNIKIVTYLLVSGIDLRIWFLIQDLVNNFWVNFLNFRTDSRKLIVLGKKYFLKFGLNKTRVNLIFGLECCLDLMHSSLSLTELMLKQLEMWYSPVVDAKVKFDQAIIVFNLVSAQVEVGLRHNFILNWNKIDFGYFWQAYTVILNGLFCWLTEARLDELLLICHFVFDLSLFFSLSDVWIGSRWR